MGSNNLKLQCVKCHSGWVTTSKDGKITCGKCGHVTETVTSRIANKDAKKEWAR